jgi:hypothetical protein
MHPRFQGTVTAKVGCPPNLSDRDGESAFIPDRFGIWTFAPEVDADAPLLLALRLWKRNDALVCLLALFPQIFSQDP